MPLYKRLADRVGRSYSIVVASTESPKITRAYLEGYDVRVDRIAWFERRTVQINATPTLLLVNHDGVIVEKWVGKQPPDSESRVVQAITDATR